MAPRPKPGSGTPAEKAAKAPKSDPPAPKRQRRTPRPRVDTILKLIRSGDFDDEIGKIQEAISDRNAERREAVNALVREVYGENWHVSTHKSNPTLPGAPDLVSGGGTANMAPGPDSGPPPEPDPLGSEGEDDPDIESRSPILS